MSLHKSIFLAIAAALVPFLGSCAAVSSAEFDALRQDLDSTKKESRENAARADRAEQRAQQATQDKAIAELRADSTLTGDVLSAMSSEADVLRASILEYEANGLDPSALKKRLETITSRIDAHEKAISENGSAIAQLAALLGKRVDDNSQNIDRIIEAAREELERLRLKGRLDAQEVSG